MKSILKFCISLVTLFFIVGSLAIWGPYAEVISQNHIWWQDMIIIWVSLGWAMASLLSFAWFVISLDEII